MTTTARSSRVKAERMGQGPGGESSGGSPREECRRRRRRAASESAIARESKKRPAIQDGIAGLMCGARVAGKMPGARAITERLRRERAAAAAAASRGRILERESRPLHRADVVDDGAVEILRREGVDEDAEPLVVDDDVVLCGRILDQQSVLEPAAATRLHADAKAATVGGDTFRLNEAPDFGCRDGRHGELDLRLLSCAHPDPPDVLASPLKRLVG